MAPTFLPGDRLLLAPAWRLRVGDVVVVDDGVRPMVKRPLLKRVASLTRSTITVTGDNSGRIGPLPRSAVVGRAVYRYGPAGRAGRLR